MPKFCSRNQIPLYLLLLSSCSSLETPTGASSLLCNERPDTSASGQPSVLSGLIIVTNEKIKTLLAQGPRCCCCCFFLQGDPDPIPGCESKQAQHPDQTSLALSHLHPQVFSFARREAETAERAFLGPHVRPQTALVATLLSFSFSPPLDLRPTIVEFLYGPYLPEPICPAAVLSSWARVRTSS